MTLWGEVKERKPLPVVWLLGGGVSVVLIALVVFFSERLGRHAGWALLWIFVLGIALALAASVEEGNRGKVWGELGRSLLVAGLLSFAVWWVDDLRRPVEEREALRLTLSLQQQMPGADLRGEDLDGFNLGGKNLEGADLEGAQLRDATLVRTNLVDANLAHADLSDANLEEVELRGADLSYADLGDVRADLADFRGARLLEADLSSSYFPGADMRGACLVGGSLEDSLLPGAHLEGAVLTGSDLEDTQFWLDLRPAYLDDVGLEGVRNADDAVWPPAFEAPFPELIALEDSNPPAVVSAAGDLDSGRVVDIADGDSLLLATPSGDIPVRLIGLDAPDLPEVGGFTAWRALEKVLPEGSRVSFAYDERRVDELGRHLLYLFGRDGKLANQVLLLRGGAVARTDPPNKKGEEVPRNVRYAAELEASETWARQNARGLWEECPL